MVRFGQLSEGCLPTGSFKVRGKYEMVMTDEMNPFISARGVRDRELGPPGQIRG